MKTTTGIILAAALALLMSACIMTGQNTFIMGIEVGATTNTTITPILVDLNEEPDYADNKDNIKSVDEISVVAIITNNLPAPATARLYLSNDESLTTVEDIEAEATLVYESPTIPASGMLKIGWKDGFKYVQNQDAIEKEVFGDGIFIIYAIAADTPFSLDVKAEIAVTITAGD